jgi:hypothetical protein
VVAVVAHIILREEHLVQAELVEEEQEVSLVVELRELLIPVAAAVALDILEDKAVVQAAQE